MQILSTAFNTDINVLYPNVCEGAEWLCVLPACLLHKQDQLQDCECTVQLNGEAYINKQANSVRTRLNIKQRLAVVCIQDHAYSHTDVAC